jgi:hypothetical protein
MAAPTDAPLGRYAGGFERGGVDLHNGVEYPPHRPQV